MNKSIITHLKALTAAGLLLQTLRGIKSVPGNVLASLQTVARGLCLSCFTLLHRYEKIYKLFLMLKINIISDLSSWKLLFSLGNRGSTALLSWIQDLFNTDDRSMNVNKINNVLLWSERKKTNVSKSRKWWAFILFYSFLIKHLVLYH